MDLSQPLPPEPALNVGWLVELPLNAVEDAIQRRLAARGFGDIRTAHGKVFTYVQSEGSRLTDLARRANMTKQSMQYLVDELERLGYTERVPAPHDRRAKLVRLTPRGREAVLVGREAIAATERRWAQGLGPHKMAKLRLLLEELVDLIRVDGAR